MNLVETTVVFIVVRAGVMLIEASNGTNKVTANKVTEVILMIVFFSNVNNKWMFWRDGYRYDH